MSDENKKSSTGMDENIAGLLTYLLGIFTGILFLAIEKDSKFVKFHAMQSILISLFLIILNIVLSFIPLIGWLLSLLISPLILILWIVLMVKAYKGETFKLPYIGDIADKQINTNS